VKLVKKLKGFKVMELNQLEQNEQGCKFIVCSGEYDDIEFECETLKESVENIQSY